MKQTKIYRGREFKYIAKRKGGYSEYESSNGDYILVDRYGKVTHASDVEAWEDEKNYQWGL